MGPDEKVSGPEAAGLKSSRLFGEEWLDCAETVLTVLARRQRIHADLVPLMVNAKMVNASSGMPICAKIAVFPAPIVVFPAFKTRINYNCNLPCKWRPRRHPRFFRCNINILVPQID